MVKKLKSKLDILRVFKDILSWKTIKQISKEIKLSYQPTYTYLNELEKEGFLRHKREGNVHLYSLNLKDNRVIREIGNIEFYKTQDFMNYSNKKISLVLTEFLGQVQKNSLLRIVLLFGSTARKSRIKTSDIDIFVVIDTKEDSNIKRICNTFNMKYSVKILPIVVSLNEFREMLIERNDFVENLINEKIILYGFEAYINELINSMGRLKWI